MRRYQKRKACRYLEQAIRLRLNDKRIEKDLRSIYKKEFLSFFKENSEREIRQQKVIDSQLKEIRKLRSKMSSLERLNESLNRRVEQAKWEINNTEKSVNKEMENRILAIRKDYEGGIAAIKMEKESLEEAKELAEGDFARLTTEIMEAKAELEGRSLIEAARAVEEIMGTSLWRALSEKTRTFLATAEQVSSMLTEKEDKPDYSLVGMELCKALETEINRTLVAPFLESLNGNRDEFFKINQTGESKGKPRYFTYRSVEPS